MSSLCKHWMGMCVCVCDVGTYQRHKNSGAIAEVGEGKNGGNTAAMLVDQVKLRQHNGTLKLEKKVPSPHR